MKMTPELLDRLARRFAALADANRLRLIQHLKDGECRVGDLAEALDLPQPTVSRHLAMLREVGLVGCRRQGTQAFYAVRDRSLFALCELVCGAVAKDARRQLAALTPDQET